MIPAIKERVILAVLTVLGVFGTGVVSAAAAGPKSTIPATAMAVFAGGVVAVIHYFVTNESQLAAAAEQSASKVSGVPAGVLNRLLQSAVGLAEEQFGRNATVADALRYVTGATAALPTTNSPAAAISIFGAVEKILGRDAVVTHLLNYVTSSVVAPSAPAATIPALSGLAVVEPAAVVPPAAAVADPPPVVSGTPPTA